MEIDDSAIIMRGKPITKPGQQFVPVRRELFQRVQQEFKAAGIRSPAASSSSMFRHGTPPEQAAAAAAAAQEQTQAAE